MARYPVKTPTFSSVFITEHVGPVEIDGVEIEVWRATDQTTGVVATGPTESDAFDNLRDYMIQKMS